MSKNPEEVKEQMPKSLIDEFVSYRKHPEYTYNMKEVSYREFYFQFAETGQEGDEVSAGIEDIDQNKGADESNEVDES